MKLTRRFKSAMLRENSKVRAADSSTSGNSKGSRTIHVLPFSNLLYRMANRLAPNARVKTKNPPGKTGHIKLISDDMVRTLRAEYKPHVVTAKMLAAKYGMPLGTIQNIVCGNARQDVT